MIYIFILFLFLICTLKYDVRHNKKSNICVNTLLVILVLLAALRYRVGTDTIIYNDEYNKYGLSYIKDRYLIGWYIFIKFFKTLGCSFYVVQFVIAAIVNYSVFKFLKKEQNRLLFSALTIYYVLIYPGWNFEILRQSLCISIFLLSYRLLEEKKYVKYYINSIIACTIHETAFLLLFLPLLKTIKITKTNLYIIEALSILSIFLAPFIRQFILDYTMVLEFADEKAMLYLGNVDVVVSASSIISYCFNILLNAIFPYWVIHKNLKTNRRNNLFNVFALMSILIYVLSIYIPLLYRINYYFILFTYLLYIDGIEYITRCLCKKFKYGVYFLLFISLLAVKARLYFTRNEFGTPAYVHYYPYTNIFDERIICDREELNFK